MLLRLLLPFCGERERDGRDIGTRLVLPPQILIRSCANLSWNLSCSPKQEVWNHYFNIRFVNLALPPSKMRNLALLRFEISTSALHLRHVT